MPSYLFFLYLVNTIVLAIFFFLLQFRMKRSRKEAEYFWVFVLGLVLPGIGLVGAWLVLQLAKIQGEEKRYIQHDRFQVDNFNEIGLISMQRRQSLPISMGLQTLDDDKGKELVFQLIESNIPNQGRYLKAAVTKPSSETAHYAATALNMLTKRYDSRLQKMQQQVDEWQDEDSYRNLIKLYKDYINSDLLTDNLLIEKKQAYQSILEQSIQLFPEDVQFFEWLVLYLWQEDQLQATATLAERVINTFSSNEECFVILVQLYLQIGDNEKLQETMIRIEQQYPSGGIPTRIQQLLSIVKGGE